MDLPAFVTGGAMRVEALDRKRYHCDGVRMSCFRPCEKEGWNSTLPPQIGLSMIVKIRKNR